MAGISWTIIKELTVTSLSNMTKLRNFLQEGLDHGYAAKTGPRIVHCNVVSAPSDPYQLLTILKSMKFGVTKGIIIPRNSFTNAQHVVRHLRKKKNFVLAKKVTKTNRPPKVEMVSCASFVIPGRNFECIKMPYKSFL